MAVLLGGAGLIALLVLLVGSGGARANGSDQNAAAVPAAAASLFGVFSQSATPADALPSQSAYAGGASRRIGPDAGSISAWAVSTGDQMCITLSASSGVGEGGPAACNSVSELSAPNQLLVLGASSGSSTSSASQVPQVQAPQVLVGLVPDGASSVEVDFTDGSSTVAPVSNNGFLLNLDGRTPDAFKWSVNGAAFAEKG